MTGEGIERFGPRRLHTGLPLRHRLFLAGPEIARGAANGFALAALTLARRIENNFRVGWPGEAAGRPVIGIQHASHALIPLERWSRIFFEPLKGARDDGRR